MQKHSRKHHRGRNSLINANERVPESASSLLMRIPDAIGNQEDFAVTYLKQEYLSKFSRKVLFLQSFAVRQRLTSGSRRRRRTS